MREITLYGSGSGWQWEMGGDVGKASWRRWYLSLALKDYIVLAKKFVQVFL